MVQPSNEPIIFVFATNESASDWSGRAKIALEQYGASMDVLHGHCGQSYAINTHNRLGKPLPDELVEQQINQFREFVAANPQNTYLITPIGSLKPVCGNCRHREFRGAVPVAKEILGNCAFEPNAFWFGPTAQCKNHQHAFTLRPAVAPAPTETDWRASGSNKKADRPVDTPI